jgi:hypothetical protein
MAHQILRMFYVPRIRSSGEFVAPTYVRAVDEIDAREKARQFHGLLSLHEIGGAQLLSETYVAGMGIIESIK